MSRCRIHEADLFRRVSTATEPSTVSLAARARARSQLLLHMDVAVRGMLSAKSNQCVSTFVAVPAEIQLT
jgi:hypothetical protein